MTRHEIGLGREMALPRVQDFMLALGPEGLSRNTSCPMARDFDSFLVGKQNTMKALVEDLRSQKIGSYVQREGDVKLYYERHGDPQGPHRVLFVMGLATSHRSWEPQVEHFKKKPGFQVAVFDNRGVGYSSFPPGPYSMKMMSDDALAITDALGWETFHLVGVSMGGMISQHVSLAVPHRIQSLTLIATRMEGGFWNSLPPIAGVWGLVKSRLNQTPEGQINALLETLFPVTWLESPSSDHHHKVHHKRYAPEGFDPETSRLLNKEWLSKKMLERRLAMPVPPLFAVRGQLAAIRGHGLSGEQIETLKKAKFPKLVITGNIDYLIAHTHSERIKDLIDAELMLLDGVGHGVCEQACQEVNDRLETHFLSAEATTTSSSDSSTTTVEASL